MGSILDPRARSAYLAEIEPALWREHDFQGSEGPKKPPKCTPKRHRPATWLQERLGRLLCLVLYKFCIHFGLHFRPPNRLEKASNIDETWVSFSDLGRGQFDLGAEWSSGVRAVRKTLQAWRCSLARTRVKRSASQTRSSHRKRWSADSIASRIPPGQVSRKM